MTATPDKADVTSEPVTVTIQARITDDRSGVDDSDITMFASPSQDNGASSDTLAAPASRVSGTKNDGIYEARITIPTGTTRTGPWAAYPGHLVDLAGNSGPSSDASAETFTVTNTPQDTAGPVVSDFDFTPKSVELNNGPKDVTVSVRLTDATGAKAPHMLIGSDDTSQSHGFGQMTRVSGTAKDGVYERTVTMPTTAAPGTWHVTLYPVEDTLGNDGPGFQDHPTKLTVTNTPQDTAGPVVSDFDFTPKSVELNNGPKDVTVSVRLTDATGAKAPHMLIGSDDTSQSHGFGQMTRVSGTAKDGVYERTVTMPTTAAPGTWHVTLYPVEDTLGNDGPGFQDHPTKLTVTNTPQSTAPDAPAGVAATRGDKSAVVFWTKPTSNGSPVTGYTITSTPGGVSKSVDADTTSTTIGGLTNGTAYTFTVVATNAVGTSTASDPSNEVTPAGVPDTVTKPTATRGDKSAVVSWTKPSSNGSPVTGYTITSTPGGVSKSVDADTTSTTIGGLTNGTAYTFTVVATNAVGTSTASDPSNEVTPAGVPDTVTKPTATRGDKSAVVSWTKPSGNGSPVTGYTVTAAPGGATKTVDADTTTATIGGLTNGTAYTFTVTATNAIGGSPASEPSNEVTPAAPATAPSAPANVTAAGGNASATVSWTAPNENNSPVTGYTITSAPGGVSKSVPADTTSTTIDGLTNGTTYTFTVTATNVVGVSPASNASNEVTPAAPATVPDRVDKPQAKVKNRKVVIRWEPVSSNGSDLISYTVASNRGHLKTVPPGKTKVVFRKLKPGRYKFNVTATNNVGDSRSSRKVRVRVR